MPEQYKCSTCIAVSAHMTARRMINSTFYKLNLNLKLVFNILIIFNQKHKYNYI